MLGYNPNFVGPPEELGVVMSFATEIATGSRHNGSMPDPHATPPLGRQCYAWSKEEDHAHDIFETKAHWIAFHNKLTLGKDYDITTDAVGNMYFTVFGKKQLLNTETKENEEVNSNEKGIILGSHLDSTPNGGIYDGVIGVGAGLEVVDNLLKKGKPKKSITVVAWRGEESSPNNGVGCLGSQIATGQISMEKIEKIVYQKDTDGKDISFLEHLAGKNGITPEAMRGKIQEMLEQGNAFSEEYGLNLEIHIEQSGVIEAQGKDLGIVTGGIGGARREKWSKDITAHEEIFPTSAYRFERIKISGKRGHTGGTPPNPVKNKTQLTEGQSWYRQDALVGLSALIDTLPDGVIVREIGYGSPLGFTSIPDDTFVDIAFPREVHHAFFDTLEKDYGLEANAEKIDINLIENPSFIGYEVSKIRADLAMPLRISHVATDRMQSEIDANPDNQVGVSRVTVVDFALKEGKISWNLDYRHIGEASTFDTLIQAVREAVNSTIEPVLVSHGLSTKVSDEVAQLLKTKANNLGFSYVLMPSSPGHDAAYVGKTGVPTGMIFIRHDGTSHHPAEHMDVAQLHKPLKLLEEVVGDYAYGTA